MRERATNPDPGAVRLRFAGADGTEAVLTPRRDVDRMAVDVLRRPVAPGAGGARADPRLRVLRGVSKPAFASIACRPRAAALSSASYPSVDTSDASPSDKSDSEPNASSSATELSCDCRSDRVRRRAPAPPAVDLTLARAAALGLITRTYTHEHAPW